MEKSGLNFENHFVPKSSSAFFSQSHIANNGEATVNRRPPLPNGSIISKENINHQESHKYENLKVYAITKENDNHGHNAQTVNREPFSNLYKNFKISYDEQSNNNQFNSIQSLENQIAANTEKYTKNITLNDPTIGHLLNESSKQIDKVHKMLEEHRRKKALKQISTQSDDERGLTHPDVEEKQNRDFKNNVHDVKEDHGQRENILIEDVNQTNRNHPNYSDNLSSFPSAHKQIPLMRELSPEQNISHKNNHILSQNQSQSLYKPSLAKQESLSKLTRRQSKPTSLDIQYTSNFAVPRTSVTNSNSVKHNNEFHPLSLMGSEKGLSSDKSQRGISIDEKLKRKSLDRENNLRQQRADKNKQEEVELQKAPKISKNSINILKNSKREKENQEIKQMLVNDKTKQKKSQSPMSQGISMTQFKSLRGAVSGQNEISKKENNKDLKNREKTPQFVYRNVQQDSLSARNKIESPQVRDISQDFDKENRNIKIITSGAFVNPLQKEDPSVPSSSKSFQTLNFGEDLKKLRTFNSTDSGLDIDSGYTEFLGSACELSSKLKSKNNLHQGIVKKGNDLCASNESKSPITPINRHTVDQQTNKTMSPRLQIGNYGRFSSQNNASQQGVKLKENQMKGRNEDLKIEIIEKNLKRIQNEYLFPKNTNNPTPVCKKPSNNDSIMSTKNEYLKKDGEQRRLSKSHEENQRLSSPDNRKSVRDAGVSHESLVRSSQLRQSKLNGPSENSLLESKANRFRESPSLNEMQAQNRSHHNLYIQSPQAKNNNSENDVYARNHVWLSAKNSKIENLNSCREKEEMKECTFRPLLLTKSLRPNININDLIPIPKPAVSGSPNFGSARSNKKFQEHLRLLESPNQRTSSVKSNSSSKEKKDQYTYKQIYEARKSHTIYHNEQPMNPVSRVSHTNVVKKI